MNAPSVASPPSTGQIYRQNRSPSVASERASAAPAPAQVRIVAALRPPHSRIARRAGAAGAPERRGAAAAALRRPPARVPRRPADERTAAARGGSGREGPPNWPPNWPPRLCTACAWSESSAPPASRPRRPCRACSAAPPLGPGPARPRPGSLSRGGHGPLPPPGERESAGPIKTRDRACPGGKNRRASAALGFPTSGGLSAQGPAGLDRAGPNRIGPGRAGPTAPPDAGHGRVLSGPTGAVGPCRARRGIASAAQRARPVRGGAAGSARAPSRRPGGRPRYEGRAIRISARLAPP